MRSVLFVVGGLGLGLLACNSSSGSPNGAGSGAPGRGTAEPATPSVRMEIEREVVFEGMCDASGAVELDPYTFMIADDEDNLLRIYDAEKGGPPLAAVDVSLGVGLTPKGKKKPTMPELDLEAGTRTGDRAYWITSHGRNSKGRVKPERMRFFSTTLPADPRAAGSVQVQGMRDDLLDLLLADPRYVALGLPHAATLAPKAEGGLNLEGMTAAPDGTLLLGLRNPVPAGRAILFKIDQADRLLVGNEGTGGELLSAPIRLDLGGLGVRAITWWRDRYLMVAGHYDSGAPSKLYAWDGKGEATAVDVDLRAYNPEATFTPDSGERMMLMSDDGSRVIDGVECKKLKDKSQRRFRAIWLRPADRT